MSVMAKNNPEWFYQYLTRDTTLHPSLRAIEADRKAGMPESLIEQEYYVSWTASSEEVLIPLDIVYPAVDREPDIDAVLSSHRIMGVDVAFAAKGDKAVIARRQGPYLHPLEKYQGKDNMSLATRVGYLIDEWKPRAVFIDAGRGEGVISRLIQLGYGQFIHPVHFGGKVYSSLYHRKKDEMYCLLKLWLEDTTSPACIPNDEDLIKDLTSPTFVINDNGYIQIESKKALKSRGISSTDDSDAVALTFAHDFGTAVPERELLMKRVSSDRWYLDDPEFDDTPVYNPLTYMEDRYSSNAGNLN
jgi:hypothetical protein